MKIIPHVRTAMNKTSWGWIVAMALAATMLPGCMKRTSGERLGGGFSDDPRVYVDHETGCEYLSASGNGITPRLDRNGKHICREKP